MGIAFYLVGAYFSVLEAANTDYRHNIKLWQDGKLSHKPKLRLMPYPTTARHDFLSFYGTFAQFLGGWVYALGAVMQLLSTHYTMSNMQQVALVQLPFIVGALLFVVGAYLMAAEATNSWWCGSFSVMLALQWEVICMLCQLRALSVVHQSWFIQLIAGKLCNWVQTACMTHGTWPGWRHLYAIAQLSTRCEAIAIACMHSKIAFCMQVGFLSAASRRLPGGPGTLDTVHDHGGFVSLLHWRNHHDVPEEHAAGTLADCKWRHICFRRVLDHDAEYPSDCGGVCTTVVDAGMMHLVTGVLAVLSHSDRHLDGPEAARQRGMGQKIAGLLRPAASFQ